MPWRPYSYSTRIGRRPGRAGRLGWIRCRACTPGFSSAERTYSSAPSGSPSKDPGVQVEHPAGLEREVGVAGKDPGPVLPGFDRVRGQPAPHRGGRHRRDHAASAASTASSGQLHLASGMSVSAGSSQANAFTSATWTALNRRGRPGPGRSVRPASRSPANRRRHLRTVSTCTPRSAAIAAFDRAVGGGQDDPGRGPHHGVRPGRRVARPVSSSAPRRTR